MSGLLSTLLNKVNVLSSSGVILKKVLIKGNQILDDVDVLRVSRLHQGQRLYDLEPYRLAARLQTHPIVQKADVRRKFPDEIHLNITEYQPFALLAISKQTNVFSIVSPSKKKVCTDQ